MANDTKYVELNVSFPISMDFKFEEGVTLTEAEEIATDLVMNAVMNDERVDWSEINTERLWVEPLAAEDDGEEE